LRRGLILVLVLGALLALMLPHLGAAPLERAEIYFLDVARAMVESGDWLVPRYQGELFFDKPPLTYWLMALTFLGLGPEPGAARLVPVVAALGVVLATVWLGALLFDRRTAVLGALVLGTTLTFLSFARVAMSDMPLAFLTTLAVALGVRSFAPDPPPWIVPALGAVLGLGFAAKGPIALVVAGLALLLLGVEHRRRPLPVGPGRALAALVTFVVLGLGWYALVFLRLGAAPLAHFFLRENLQRFAGDAYDAGQGPWFYAAAYLADGVPWSLLLPLALWRLLRRDGGDPEGRAAARFLAAWIGLVVVLLTLSRGKLDYYLLPLYPAVSLLIGRFLAAVPWRRLDRAWVRGVLLLAVATVAVAVAHPPRVPAQWLPGPWGRGLLVAVLAASALAALVVALRPSPRGVLAVLGGGMAASWLVVVIFFLPAFVAAQPNRSIVADVAREQRYRPDLRLALCDDPARARRDLLFHLRLAARERCDLWAYAASREPYLLLVSPDENRSLRVIPRYRTVATYRYLPADVLTLEGLLVASEPGRIILAANFKTTDPVAVRKRKRERRKAILRQRAEHRAKQRRGQSSSASPKKN
jgi:4-amino-4-deoxy-L-arabinose transferase-like glycosyltransferase